MALASDAAWLPTSSGVKTVVVMVVVVTVVVVEVLVFVSVVVAGTVVVDSVVDAVVVVVGGLLDVVRLVVVDKVVVVSGVVLFVVVLAGGAVVVSGASVVGSGFGVVLGSVEVLSGGRGVVVSDSVEVVDHPSTFLQLGSPSSGGAAWRPPMELHRKGPTITPRSCGASKPTRLTRTFLTGTSPATKNQRELRRSRLIRRLHFQHQATAARKSTRPIPSTVRPAIKHVRHCQAARDPSKPFRRL